jgi:hypothetical protein
MKCLYYSGQNLKYMLTAGGGEANRV